MTHWIFQGKEPCISEAYSPQSVTEEKISYIPTSKELLKKQKSSSSSSNAESSSSSSLESESSTCSSSDCSP